MRYPINPEVPEVNYCIGVDLAQGGADASCISVIEQTEMVNGELPEYAVIHLERYRDRLAPQIIPERLGVIWLMLQQMHAKREARRYGSIGAGPLETPIRIAVDATGVGPFGVAPMIQAGFDPISILIHGGNAVTHPASDRYHVPKKDLAGVVGVLLGTNRLKIAKNMDHADRLKAELQNFRVKVSASGHESFAAGVGGDAWREGAHDDLVLATAIGTWLMEHESVPYLDPYLALAFKRGGLPTRNRSY